MTPRTGLALARVLAISLVLLAAHAGLAAPSTVVLSVEGMT